MPWEVLFHEALESQLKALDTDLQDEILAHARLLQDFGPVLGRPMVDTLKGSRYPNMKELRIRWRRNVWRVAFAFDPERRAVLPAAGDQRGTDQRRFYRRLMDVADSRFDEHLAAVAPSAGSAQPRKGRHGKKP